VLVDLRREGNGPEGGGRIDTVIWADGTWPAPHVLARGLKLEAGAHK